MKRQRNTQQTKEQDKSPPKQTKEEEIGNLPDKEFQIMIVKLIQRGLSRVEAGNPGFPRLVQRPEGASHGGSEKPGKLEVGGASRGSTGLGALEEGLISS